MAVEMSYFQQTRLSVTFLDSRGNPAPVEGVPVWQVDNPNVLALEPSPDGMSCLIKGVGPIGTATTSLTADADMGSGVEPIVGSIDFNITGGKAVAVELQAGPVEDQPAPPGGRASTQPVPPPGATQPPVKPQADTGGIPQGGAGQKSGRPPSQSEPPTRPGRR